MWQLFIVSCNLIRSFSEFVWPWKNYVNIVAADIMISHPVAMSGHVMYSPVWKVLWVFGPGKLVAGIKKP